MLQYKYFEKFASIAAQFVSAQDYNYKTKESKRYC